MADKTGIEWTDASWNPTTGCDRISAGCDNCYALTLAARLKAMGSPRYQHDGVAPTSGPGFALTMHDDKVFYQPLTWTRPRKIFVNSMSDLFHARVTRDFTARVFAVMLLSQRHQFQVLTKRPERMRRILTDPRFPSMVLDAVLDVAERLPAKTRTELANAAIAHLGQTDAGVMLPLPNVWLGTSVEDQQASRRIEHLCATPAAIRFLSCEPLISSLDLSTYLLNPFADGQPHQAGLDWVIAGGESGPNARPMHPLWPERLRDQCVAAGVAFLFKQWGEWSPLAPARRDGSLDFSTAIVMTDDGEIYAPPSVAWPDGERAGEALRSGFARKNPHFVYRPGKHRAGRELDGRLWDEYPVTAVVERAS